MILYRRAPSNQASLDVGYKARRNVLASVGASIVTITFNEYNDQKSPRQLTAQAWLQLMAIHSRPNQRLWMGNSR